MPVKSYAPIFHELGLPPTGIEGDTAQRPQLYDRRDNWGEVISWNSTQPNGFFAYGRDEDREHREGSLGLLPTHLPDGARPNTITVAGYSPGDAMFQLFSQSHEYPVHEMLNEAARAGGTAELANVNVGSKVFYRTEESRLKRSGPMFKRTVPIKNVPGGTTDNADNWYGIYAWVKSNYCTLTGVSITYDESEITDRLRKSSTVEEPVRIDTRDIVIDIDATGHSYVGLIRDGEVLELEESTTGDTTFVLAPGEYEIWSDGDSVDITESQLVTDGTFPPRTPSHRFTRETDESGQ